ncbi:hypothetical protein LVJ83_13225 [Uruburuella testudinis]|uniref:Surface-adhesin protein E-like domain-containing protein n=1 Tax=Uruburuella testudinis TaxID=1282863 RepID=A0ABY4DYT8_9NEIS|nr:surface-adhesin E family protein [Uruburuella testudinis]UOO81846.1 hypothetical protein LVJ83_13225 [Uruburuella testudinis]
MNISRALHYTAAAALAALLAACAATGPDVAGNWKEIGTINSGNIKAAIDTSSIKRNGQLATFRDKKTVLKPSEERYVNTPAYKTAVGEWEIHCRNKTYRLTALQLLDERGQVLMNQKYTAAGLRPMSVMGGSITEKQFETVCK